MSFAMVSNQAATFATIKSEDMGRASSLSTANRQIAGALGVAFLATILIEQSGVTAGAGALSPAAQASMLSGFHAAFAAAALLAFGGFLLTFLVHDEDAVATLHRGAVRTPTPVAAAAD